MKPINELTRKIIKEQRLNNHYSPGDADILAHRSLEERLYNALEDIEAVIFQDLTVDQIKTIIRCELKRFS